MLDVSFSATTLPRVKGNLGATWDKDAWGASLFGNYLGRVADSDVPDALRGFGWIPAPELAALGGQLIVQALQLAGQGALRPVPQPAEGVSYAHKIDKHEAAIDWRQPAALIERRIRAFDPFPGASTTLGDAVIKLWRSEIDSCLRTPDARCGQIFAINDAGITVACGDGALRLTELQRPGGKRLPAREFLRGFALAPGQCLGQAGDAP